MRKKPAARPRKRTDHIEASIVNLKKEVRMKVTSGHVTAQGRKLTNLEAREIQIKIADLETKAAKIATADSNKNGPGRAQKVIKQAEALKRKLST